MITTYKEEMQQMGKIYGEETEKDFRELLDDNDERQFYRYLDHEQMLLSHLSEQGIPTSNDDIEHLEFRSFGDYDIGIDKDVEDPRWFPENDQKGWNPYEQDLSLYPEIFKVYGENFNRYENAKQHFENEPLG